MKKKWFSIALAFVLFLTSTICLTACGGVGKNYFTMENPPKHCTVSFSNYGVGNDGKEYVEKGREVEIYVSVDEGYYSNNFAMYINTQKVELIKNYRETTNTIDSYIYRFTPQHEFKITFGGSFKEVAKTFVFRKETRTEEDGSYEPFDASKPENSEVYIRFGEHNPLQFSTTEKTYAEFMTSTFNSLGLSQVFNYGTKVDFYVYTKGYKGDPNIHTFEIADDYANASIDEKREIYQEGENFGYHVTFTQGYNNVKLIFKNAAFYTTYYFKSPEAMNGTKNWGSKKLKMQLADDLSTLTISFNKWNTIDQTTKNSFSNLKLKINDKVQNINFKTDDNDDGVFVVPLNAPYTYLDTVDDIYRAFILYIDLNYYDLPYFANEKFDSFDSEIFDSDVAGKSFIFSKVELMNKEGVMLEQEEYAPLLLIEQELQTANSGQLDVEPIHEYTTIAFSSTNHSVMSDLCYDGGTINESCTYYYHNDVRENTVEIFETNDSGEQIKILEGNCIGNKLILKMTVPSDNRCMWVFTFDLM